MSIESYASYATEIRIISEHLVSLGYDNIDEFEIKKHYSMSDLYEIVGLYLASMPERVKVEYIVESNELSTLANSLIMYMTKQKDVLEEVVRKDIVSTLCDSLVKDALENIIDKINEYIPIYRHELNFSSQQSMFLSSHNYI